MSRDTISINELEPLVEKIEVIASCLDTFLQECADEGFPSQLFCDDIERKVSEAPNLRKWLNELRRNEKG